MQFAYNMFSLFVREPEIAFAKYSVELAASKGRMPLMEVPIKNANATFYRDPKKNTPSVA